LPNSTETPTTTDGPTPLQPANASLDQPQTIVALKFENPINIRIVFAYDSASLSDDQTPKLMQMCRVMKAGDVDLFRIVGHTDAAGPDSYNERLSLLRAKEVKRFLVEECAIPEAKLDPIGFGERFLYDTADPRNGLNRRVEFQALG
jgi:outer membrane protein OmpA-like peptidoglycan-associated protein